MTQEETLTDVISMIVGGMEFLLPIIAVMSGVTFVISWILYIVFGWGRRSFRD